LRLFKILKFKFYFHKLDYLIQHHKNFNHISNLVYLIYANYQHTQYILQRHFHTFCICNYNLLLLIVIDIILNITIYTSTNWILWSYIIKVLIAKTIWHRSMRIIDTIQTIYCSISTCFAFIIAFCINSFISQLYIIEIFKIKKKNYTLTNWIF